MNDQNLLNKTSDTNLIKHKDDLYPKKKIYNPKDMEYFHLKENDLYGNFTNIGIL